MTITLKQVARFEPCAAEADKMLAHLGVTRETYDPSTEIAIGDIANVCGAAAGMWALRCIDDPRQRVRAVLPAVKRASAYTTDERVHDCIAATSAWLAGDDSVDLRKAAAERAAQVADLIALFGLKVS